VKKQGGLIGIKKGLLKLLRCRKFYKRGKYNSRRGKKKLLLKGKKKGLLKAGDKPRKKVLKMKLGRSGSLISKKKGHLAVPWKGERS